MGFKLHVEDVRRGKGTFHLLLHRVSSSHYLSSVGPTAIIACKLGLHVLQSEI